MLGIERTCPGCGVRFQYCEHCWRGHKYCSQVCSREGRRRNRLSADKKYSLTPKGRENRRLRQKKFRERKKSRASVTDHSPVPQSPPLSCTLNLTVNLQRCSLCGVFIRIVVGVDHGREDDFATGKESPYFSFARFRSKNHRLSL